MLTLEEYYYSPFTQKFCLVSAAKLFIICQKNSIALDYPAMFMAKRSPLYYSLYCQKIHLSFFRHIFSFFIDLSLQQGVSDSVCTIDSQKIEGSNAMLSIILAENSFDYFMDKNMYSSNG